MNKRMHIFRRFGWVIPLAIVAVSAIAAGVATETGKNVSAQSVVVVSPGTASTAPGQAGEARALATTYAAQLPADQGLLQRLRARTQLSPAALRSAIRSVQVPNTALVSVTFTAPRAALAANGIRALAGFATTPPASSSLAPVPPRLVAIDPVVARPGHGFAASATLVIPSVPPTAGPGDADQANKVAAIMTGLIPQDQPTLGAVARQLRMSPADVRAAVSAANEQNTSLIDLTFKDHSPRVAQAGAIAFARAVSGAHPASPNIPSGSMSTVSLPGQPDAGSPLKIALPAGVVLGAILGIVLMLALRRAFPRVDDERGLAEVVNCPVTALHPHDRTGIEALRTRWAGLTGARRGTVALVAATPDQEAGCRSLAETINAVGVSTANGAGVRNPVGALARSGLEAVAHHGIESPPASEEVDRHPAANLVARAGATPLGGSVDRAVLESDAAVLVVRPGTKDAEVERAASLLADFGQAPCWALLLHER